MLVKEKIYLHTAISGWKKYVYLPTLNQRYLVGDRHAAVVNEREKGWQVLFLSALILIDNSWLKFEYALVPLDNEKNDLCCNQAIRSRHRY